MNSCSGRGEDASLFKGQQEELIGETGQRLPGECVQVSATRRGHCTSSLDILPKDRAHRSRGNEDGLASPEF